jgi:hypothetical protein
MVAVCNDAQRPGATLRLRDDGQGKFHGQNAFVRYCEPGRLAVRVAGHSPKSCSTRK